MHAGRRVALRIDATRLPDGLALAAPGRQPADLPTRLVLERGLRVGVGGWGVQQRLGLEHGAEVPLPPGTGWLPKPYTGLGLARALRAGLDGAAVREGA